MPHTWTEIVAADPDHSRRYAERWDAFEAEGTDIHGEARLVDAMAPRGARILDAGCGQGRVGGLLLGRGHRVTGVDLDPYLIGICQERYPQGRWETSDLAAAGWAAGPFDLIVSAGNVLTFVDPADRVTVLRHLRDRLAASGDGRPAVLLVGFGLSRGWTPQDFTADAGRAGLRIDQRWSTWDLRPFTDSSDFLVAVLGRA